MQLRTGVRVEFRPRQTGNHGEAKDEASEAGGALWMLHAR